MKRQLLTLPCQVKSNRVKTRAPSCTFELCQQHPASSQEVSSEKSGTSDMPALAPALLRPHQANEYALTRMLINFSFTVSNHTGSTIRILNKGNVLHRQDYRRWEKWCKAHNKAVF